MRLFVCEYVTGGGLRRQPLPPALIRDGREMLDALLADLRRIPGVETLLTADDRLPGIDGAIAVAENTDVNGLWRRCLRDCDAAWFIAPETGGELLRLRHLADELDRPFIGCDAGSIFVTTSKSRTAEHLSGRGIACIETVAADGPLPEGDRGWIIKPDDGAGCEDAWYLRTPGEVEAWRRHCKADGFILQPRVAGVHASLSVLYVDGHCELLACNRQEIEIGDGIVRLAGVEVGGIRADWNALLSFARAIGRALPGLRGYVGIDFIQTGRGPVLVEINPRLTTAYAGLHGLLDGNPAEKILRALGYLAKTESRTEDTEAITACQPR
ncbi:MAG: ATP-grasp domain-containing protein [Gammaproteobacteria bacterium]